MQKQLTEKPGEIIKTKAVVTTQTFVLLKDLTSLCPPNHHEPTELHCGAGHSFGIAK